LVILFFLELRKIKLSIAVLPIMPEIACMPRAPDTYPVVAPEIIRSARMLLGLSRSQLAALTGVQDATIRNLEISSRRVRTGSYVKLRRAFQSRGLVLIETDELAGLALLKQSAPVKGEGSLYTSR
jgi:DNA-binding transcriptional regulator YiaG